MLSVKIPQEKYDMVDVDRNVDLFSDILGKDVVWRVPVQDVCNMALVCKDWNRQTKEFLRAMTKAHAKRSRKRAQARFSILHFQVIIRDPGRFSIDSTRGCDSLILNKARTHYETCETTICFDSDFGSVLQIISDLAVPNEHEMFRHGLEELFLVLNEDLLLTAERLQLIRLTPCELRNSYRVFYCECIDCLLRDHRVRETSFDDDKLFSDRSGPVLYSDMTSVMTFLSKLLIRLRRFPPIVKLELLNNLYYVYSEDDDD